MRKNEAVSNKPLHFLFQALWSRKYVDLMCLTIRYFLNIINRNV